MQYTTQHSLRVKETPHLNSLYKFSLTSENFNCIITYFNSSSMLSVHRLHYIFISSIKLIIYNYATIPISSYIDTQYVCTLKY